MVKDQSPLSLCRDLIDQAVAAWRVQNVEEARQCLLVARDLSPQNEEVLAFTAALAEVSGSSSEAVEVITHLAEISGFDRAAHEVAEAIEVLNTQEISDLRAAFCEVELKLPALPVALQGYAGGSEDRLASNVHWPLMMQAIMLEDGSGQRCLWITADLFGFDPVMVREVRKFAKLWGIKPEGVFLNASHTHYAPGTINRILPLLGSTSDDFIKQVITQIVCLLPLLRQNLRTVEAEVSSTEALCGVFRRIKNEDGSVNRNVFPNQDATLTDHHVSLARLRWLENNEQVLLINLGNHPTEFSRLDILTAAFPFALREGLKQSHGLKGVLFFQGCAGDHRPGIKANGQFQWPTTLQESISISHPPLQAIRQALNEPFKALRKDLKFAAHIVNLPLQKRDQSFQDIVRGVQGERMEGMYRQWAQVLTQVPSLDEEFVPVEIITHQIGDWSIVGMSGEPVAEYGRMLRADLGKEAFICGYTNGLSSYLPTSEMIKEGGYEGLDSQVVYLRSAPFQEGIEYHIIHSVHLLQQQPPRIPARRLNSSQLDERSKHRAFFVLSTGRSGTQTLAHLLDTATNAKVWHHPEPNMIMETLHAYQGLIDARESFWVGRSHILCQAWESGLIHGETDHNMTPFATAIARDVPQARFLVLVRDPREFIRSGMRRGYYIAGGPWDEGRLKPLEHAETLGWDEFNPFEKVCWLWAETYRHINKSIAEIGADRVKIVRFEDLIRGPEVAAEIFEFLGLEGFTIDHAETVLSQKLNAQRGGDFPHPREWNQELHTIAWEYCGEIASGYGYTESYLG